MFFSTKRKMNYIEYYKNLPSSIVYIDDTEYRNAIRKVFYFDPKKMYTYNGKVTNFEQLDSVTKDELNLDSDMIKTSMDALYNATKHESLFQELYLSAAGRMFSTEQEIGHAVLCSYDTFSLYHSCVWHYLHGGVASLLILHHYTELNAYLKN